MRNKRFNLLLGGIFFIFFFIIFITMYACGGGSSSRSSGEPKISVSPSTFNFGGIAKYKTTDNTFTISNTGTADLKIEQITVTGTGFSINAGHDACSNKTLAPSDSCNLLVLFSPSDQAPNNGVLHIPSNLATKNVTLSGQGYGLDVWINQIEGDCSGIKIYATVIDPETSDPLMDPAQLRFSLKQGDGTPQLINSGSIINENPDPVSVVLALDLSNSLFVALGDIKTAAKSFIDQSHDEDAGAMDEVAICRFKNQYTFYPTDDYDFTQTTKVNKQLLKNKIDIDPVLNDGTILFDALYKAIERAALGGTTGKPAVILLSDGADNPYNTTEANTLESVITYANAQTIPVPIFTIFYVDSSNPFYSQDANPDILRDEIAKKTGGQYYSSLNPDEMGDVFGKISKILSNKHTITYTPNNCSSGSTIILEVTIEDSITGMWGKELRTYIIP